MMTAEAIVAQNGGDSAITLPSGHLVDGKIVSGTGSYEVIDPSLGKPFATCPDASRNDLEMAVSAARRAFPAWRDLGFEARRAAVCTLADRIMEAQDRLALLLTSEHGKPLDQAKFELMVAAFHMKELVTIALPAQVLRDDERGRVLLQYHPLGVVGAIAPWNFPIALGMHKVAHALYTGNTLILKPSPFTPLTTLAVGELAADIFPVGVLNIIAGGNDFGVWMTEHPGIDKISFTGSVETGKKVMASAATTLKRVTLELGGNDAAIVLDDADLDFAAAGLANSSFFNSGQICMATKRIYVARSIHDAFVEKLVAIVSHLRIGRGIEAGVTTGPLQNRAQFDKVADYLADALRQPHAQVRTGGHVVDGDGYFIEPTVITGLDERTRLVCEEQFGPVLPVMVFDDDAEAVRRANDSRFGLGASVWTRNMDRALAVGKQLMAGSVWINRHAVNEADVPFGGMRDSGLGREHGELGLRSYMELQVISFPPTA